MIDAYPPFVRPVMRWPAGTAGTGLARWTAARGGRLSFRGSLVRLCCAHGAPDAPGVLSMAVVATIVVCVLPVPSEPGTSWPAEAQGSAEGSPVRGCATVPGGSGASHGSWTHAGASPFPRFASQRHADRLTHRGESALLAGSRDRHGAHVSRKPAVGAALGAALQRTRTRRSAQMSATG